MTNAIRLTAFILSLTLAYPANAADIPVAPASPVRETTTSAPTLPPTAEPDNVENVEVVLARFATMGIPLPHIDFHFHSNSDPCQGNKGLHSATSDSHRIDLCTSEQIERLLLHEVAHVWIGHNVAPHARPAFLTLRGLHSWNDPGTEWRSRGTEHAAQIMAWGMSEQCARPQWIGQTEPADLLEAFEFLTGEPPTCELDRTNKHKEEIVARLGGVQV